jgi:hypothetical protein
MSCQLISERGSGVHTIKQGLRLPSNVRHPHQFRLLYLLFPLFWYDLLSVLRILSVAMAGGFLHLDSSTISQWPEPNQVNPEIRSRHLFLAFAIVSTAFTVIAIFTRFITNLRRTNRIRLDDIILMISWVRIALASSRLRPNGRIRLSASFFLRSLYSALSISTSTSICGMCLGQTTIQLHLYAIRTSLSLQQLTY